MEIWRDIDGYEGLYQVSNFGRVKSFQRGKPRILKAFLNSGYLSVVLYRDHKVKQCLVHRLVALAFIPNPEDKPLVNHINGVKTDNCVENLEWATAAYVTGLISLPQGESNYQAKLTNEQAVYIRENPDGLSTVELAQVFGIYHGTVSRIQLGQNYHGAGGMIREPRHRKHAVHLPGEVRERIRAEYKARKHGHGCYALAKKYGVHPSTILKIINEK